nr:uncharacterized protein LOC111985683 [Quercus suber]
MTRMFELQLGKSIEIYIDDMVVKIKVVFEHVKDLGNIFEVLKRFKWTEEYALTFQQLNDYLAQPPIMSSLKLNEVLFAYIAVAPYAVSLMLVRVNRGVQRPVYYVSKSLHEVEIRYLPLEKAILAVMLGTRKLPHYFQAHTVVVLIQLLLKTILRNADYIRRIAKWVNQKGSGVGLVLISSEKIVIEKSLRLSFMATNNEAKYKALLMGMTMVQRMGGKLVEMFSDSRLVVGQEKREFEVKDERMQGYLSQVKCIQSEFESFNLLHIPKNINAHADSLAMLVTSSTQNLPRVILVEDLDKPTEIRKKAIRVHQIRAEPSWMDLIIQFLKEDTLPEERLEANKVRRKATRFWLSENQKLYKRSFSGPYLLCIHPKAAELLLEELHEGICGSYMGGRSLAHRGLDIVGPFPKVVGNKKYLLVGTDYFTKWVEAEPLANIRDVDAKKFFWKNIVTRFGILHTLILDNGLQFDSKVFRSYCCELGITNRYSTPAYPQGNRQAEAINKVIVNGLKKRLDDTKGNWVEELPHILWTYRTTPRRSNRETPFSMTYGAKTVIPLETGFPTLRTSSFNLSSNNEQLQKNLDLIEEMRENAMVQLAYYRQKLK